jgi:DpnI-like restriction endonuclease
LTLRLFEVFNSRELKGRDVTRRTSRYIPNAVRGLNKKEFTLGEVYAFADELVCLHPHNKNIEPKIRQQLQGLRDLGFVEFVGGGNYRLS